MDKTTLKTRICQAIDDRAGEIIEIGKTLWEQPEVGFRETRSSQKVAETFRALGLEPIEGQALTGVRADLEGAGPGKTVAVLGELDALLCHRHPDADSETGAVHNCGHNAQIAAMLGVGMGLIDAGAMEHLDGCVALFAVPAEEYVELEFRQSLRDAGKIEFLAGKPELVRLGAFDDVNLALLVHSMADTPERVFSVGSTMNGFMAKTIRFAGRPAHAGASPDQGINALNAAALGIMGIHAQRETFRDEDCLRVHFVMTRGGDMVNVVPDDVRLELFVRGRTLDSIVATSAKVDRALEGAATMVGADVTIEDLPGYLPLIDAGSLTELFEENAAQLVGAENVRRGSHITACSDVGDLSHLMPVIQPSAGGYAGRNHTNDFRIVDEEMAYVVPAKAMAMTVVDLLYDGATVASQIEEAYQPKMDKEAYLAYLRGQPLEEGPLQETRSRSAWDPGQRPMAAYDCIPSRGPCPRRGRLASGPLCRWVATRRQDDLKLHN
jgi:amidohydrolase